MVEVKTSNNEGELHKQLKIKTIKELKNRNDIIVIDTEHRVRNMKKYYKFVDVWAKKKNGGEIYVEIKSRASLSEAIGQLILLDRGDDKDEFITICNFDRPNFLKSLLRNNELDVQRFVNKTKIYRFNRELDLELTKVAYKSGKELWVNEQKIMKR